MTVAIVAEALTLREFEQLMAQGVPLIGRLGCRCERFEPGICDVRLPYDPLFLRPGGTVCGPAIMALADITLYGVVLSLIGRVELAVTTDLTTHFVAKARPGDLIGRGKIVRLGRTLAVGEVTIEHAESASTVAHSVGSYAVPAAVDTVSPLP